MFKILRIIDDYYPSNKFLPNHFSKKGQNFLNFENGATIEEEQQIIIQMIQLYETLDTL